MSNNRHMWKSRRELRSFGGVDTTLGRTRQRTREIRDRMQRVPRSFAERVASTFLQRIYRRHKLNQITFFLHLEVSIYNPKRNGGNGETFTRELGPFGPYTDSPNNKHKYVAHARNELRIGGRYAEEVQFFVHSYSFQEVNKPRFFMNSLPQFLVPMERASTLRHDVRLANAISPVAFDLKTGENKCVPVALVAWLLDASTRRQITHIPSSQYDAALTSHTNPKSRPGTKARVTEESITSLLNAIRSEHESYCRSGYSTVIVKELCKIFRCNMVALDKHDEIIDSLSEFDGADRNHQPLVFYSFHGHMYFVLGKEAVTSAICSARQARRPGVASKGIEMTANDAPANHTALVVKSLSEFKVSRDLPMATYLLKGEPDVESVVYDLMTRFDIDPRVRTKGNAMVELSFFNASDEQIRVVADTHIGENIDHMQLKKIAEAKGYNYLPTSGMGSLCVQILEQKISRKRFSDEEYHSVVNTFNSLCACGCGGEIKKRGKKWLCHFDHRVPLGEDGEDTVENLQPLLTECHRAKTADENERGYFKQQAWASRFNGRLQAMLFPPVGETDYFAAHQFVQNRQFDIGQQVQLVEDGTCGRIVGRDSDGWWRVRITDEDVKVRSSKMQLTSIEECLKSQTCPVAFRARVQLIQQRGQDPVDYFELKKIDGNRFRRNIMYYSAFEWPVFNVMDHPTPFGGEIRCGLFFVETTAAFPFRGVGWYSEPLVRYGVDEGLITRSEIKLQLIPSKTLPPDYFQSHIEQLEKAFDGDPALQKLASNSFIGLQGRTRREHEFTVLSLNAAEAAGKYASNDTGYACYVRENCVTLPDGRTVWRADYKHKIAMDRTPYTIYKQELEMEAVELRTTLGRERLFDKGWSPLDCAQVIMMDLAARIVGRSCRSYEMEGAWLFALERAMRARLAAGGAACAPLLSAATGMVQPPVADLQPDGTLLPEAARLYFSADFHNSARFTILRGALRDVETKEKALKHAMKHEALRNVRDHGMVHKLTLPVPPQPNTALASRWQEEVRALWVAKPATPPPAAMGGGKKRFPVGGPAAEQDSKQPKLSFGAASSNG